MQLTINIPDAIAPRVINGICTRFQYQEILEDGTPNPQTKAQFAKQRVILFIKRTVREAEVDAAKATAEATTGASVDTEIQLS